MFLLQIPHSITRMGGEGGVGIGVTGVTDMRRPGDWAGHLVGVAAESRPDLVMFLDPTIEQINRPELGIALTPLVLRVAPAALRKAFRLEKAGCLIEYECLPEDRYFECTAEWDARVRRHAARDRILRRLQAQPRVGATASTSVPATPPVSQKTGRNDPCPCGSGRKFKKCHGG